MFKLTFKSGSRRKAFTLIELLVVIAIIGLLATLSVLALNNARAKARDAKRLADVKQIQSALELYYNSTGSYPTAAEFNSGKIEYYSPTTGTSTYMAAVPFTPTPNDGVCSVSDNTYTYVPNAGGSDYELSFCVAKAPSSSLPDGKLIAFPGGLKSASGGGGETVCDPACGYGYVCSTGVCVMKDNFFIANAYGAPDSDGYNIYNLDIDSQYIYAVGNTETEGQGLSDGVIIKYDKNDLSILAKETCGGTGQEVLSSVAENGDYIYALGMINYNTAGQNGVLTKYNKSDLSLVSATKLGSVYASAWSMTNDLNYLYIGINNSVMVYDFNMNLVRQNSYVNSIASLVVDGDYLYLVSSVSGKIVTLKVNKSTMAVEAENSYGRAGIIFFPSFNGGVDDSYFYVYGQIIGEGPSGRNAFVFKYNKSDLTLLNKKIYGEADTEYFYALALGGDYLYGLGYSGASGVGSGDIWLAKINRSDLSLASSEVIREKNLDSWGYEETYFGFYRNSYLYIAGYIDEYDDLGNSLFSNAAGLIRIKEDFVSSDTTSDASSFTVSPYTTVSAVDSNLDLTDPNITSQASSLSSDSLGSFTCIAGTMNTYGPFIIE